MNQTEPIISVASGISVNTVKKITSEAFSDINRISCIIYVIDSNRQNRSAARGTQPWKLHVSHAWPGKRGCKSPLSTQKCPGTLALPEPPEVFR